MCIYKYKSCLGVVNVFFLLCRLKLFGSRMDVVISKLNAVGKQGGSEGDDNDDEEDEVEKALRLDGTIPGSSNQFVEQVSSRAYDMRRHLQQTVDSSSYDGIFCC